MYSSRLYPHRTVENRKYHQKDHVSKLQKRGEANALLIKSSGVTSFFMLHTKLCTQSTQWILYFCCFWPIGPPWQYYQYIFVLFVILLKCSTFEGDFFVFFMGKISKFLIQNRLTCLTWLIHTSCLPSKWNLYPKIPFLA